MKRLAILVATVLSVLACAPARRQPAADFSAIDAKPETCSDAHPNIPGSANCTKSTVALGAALEHYEAVNRLYVQTKMRAKTLTALETPQNAR